MTLSLLGPLRQFYVLHAQPQDWLAAVAVAVAVAATVAMVSLRALVVRRLERLARIKAGRIDHLAAIMLANTYLPFILAFALYAGGIFLDLTRRQDLALTRLAVAALMLQCAIWGDTGLRAWRDQYRVGGDSRSCTTFAAPTTCCTWMRSRTSSWTSTAASRKKASGSPIRCRSSAWPTRTAARSCRTAHGRCRPARRCTELGAAALSYITRDNAKLMIRVRRIRGQIEAVERDHRGAPPACGRLNRRGPSDRSRFP